MRTFAAFLLLCLVWGYTPTHFASAQTSNSVSLELSPAFPEVGEEFTAKIRGVIGSPRSSLVWYMDGREQTSFNNLDEATFTATTKSTLRVRMALTDGTVIERSVVIDPYRVDILVSTNSQVPPFYKGAPLPTSGSEIRTKAIVYKNGTRVEGLTYLWKLNGTTLNGGAMRNGDSVSLHAEFQKELVVTVDVFNSAGKVIAQDSVVIPIVSPEVYFYEKNPLRGTAEISLVNPFTLIGDETTVRAEPFYINRVGNGENMLINWEINGKSVLNTSSDPRELTLQKNGQAGNATLSFEIRNMKQLLQGITKSIKVQF